MPQFMLLLYDKPAAFAAMSPAEMQAVIERYVRWSQALRAQGKLVDGKKLGSDSGRLVRRKGAEVLMSDGPFLESKELLGGYFVVNAADYDEATRLSSDCPHLDYQGTIEVRAIDVA
jgi:hypothetical protein